MHLSQPEAARQLVSRAARQGGGGGSSEAGEGSTRTDGRVRSALTVLPQGLSVSALKKACKALGAGRWPYLRRYPAKPLLIEEEWLAWYMSLGLEEDGV